MSRASFCAPSKDVVRKITAMIIEGFKIAASLWPLAKEVFLWRDGAQVGKPITEQNLIRRKIAVFALIASIVVNYIAISQFISEFKEAQKEKAHSQELEKEKMELKSQIAELQRRSDQCVDQAKLTELLQQDHAMIEHHCGPIPKPKRKK